MYPAEPWTDGELYVHPQSFYWNVDNSELATELEVGIYIKTFALWFFSYRSRFSALPSNELYSTVCYLERAPTPSEIVKGQITHKKVAPGLPGSTHIEMSKGLDSHPKGVKLVGIRPVRRSPIIPTSLDYLGKYGVKDWYIDRQAVSFC